QWLGDPLSTNLIDIPGLTWRKFGLVLSGSMPTVTRSSNCDSCRRYLLDWSPEEEPAAIYRVVRTSCQTSRCHLREIAAVISQYFRGIITAGECWNKLLDLSSHRRDELCHEAFRAGTSREEAIAIRASAPWARTPEDIVIDFRRLLVEVL